MLFSLFLPTPRRDHINSCMVTPFSNSTSGNGDFIQRWSSLESREVIHMLDNCWVCDAGILLFWKMESSDACVKVLRHSFGRKNRSILNGNVFLLESELESFQLVLKWRVGWLWMRCESESKENEASETRVVRVIEMESINERFGFRLALALFACWIVDCSLLNRRLRLLDWAGPVSF